MTAKYSKRSGTITLSNLKTLPKIEKLGTVLLVLPMKLTKRVSRALHFSKDQDGETPKFILYSTTREDKITRVIFPGPVPRKIVLDPSTIELESQALRKAFGV